MRGLFVASFFIAFVVAVWARPDDAKYTDKYDNIDIDEILRSDRLLNNYMICLKEGKKCSPDGQELRSVLPDALKSGCSKCSDTQKEKSKKVIRYLIKNKLDKFKELEEIYDPSHEYRTKYGDELKADGIVIPD